MVSINIQLDTTEQTKRFLEEQARLQHRQDISDYILNLIERERIDTALEQGLDETASEFDPAAIEEIRQDLPDT